MEELYKFVRRECTVFATVEDKENGDEEEKGGKDRNAGQLVNVLARYPVLRTFALSTFSSSVRRSFFYPHTTSSSALNGSQSVASVPDRNSLSKSVKALSALLCSSCLSLSDAVLPLGQTHKEEEEEEEGPANETESIDLEIERLSQHLKPNTKGEEKGPTKSVSVALKDFRPWIGIFFNSSKESKSFISHMLQTMDWTSLSVLFCCLVRLELLEVFAASPSLLSLSTHVDDLLARWQISLHSLHNEVLCDQRTSDQTGPPSSSSSSHKKTKKKAVSVIGTVSPAIAARILTGLSLLCKESLDMLESLSTKQRTSYTINLVDSVLKFNSGCTKDQMERTNPQRQGQISVLEKRSREESGIEDFVSPSPAKRSKTELPQSFYIVKSAILSSLSLDTKSSADQAWRTLSQNRDRLHSMTIFKEILSTIRIILANQLQSPIPNPLPLPLSLPRLVFQLFSKAQENTPQTLMKEDEETVAFVADMLDVITELIRVSELNEETNLLALGLDRFLFHLPSQSNKSVKQMMQTRWKGFLRWIREDRIHEGDQRFTKSTKTKTIRKVIRLILSDPRHAHSYCTIIDPICANSASSCFQDSFVWRLIETTLESTKTKENKRKAKAITKILTPSLEEHALLINKTSKICFNRPIFWIMQQIITATTINLLESSPPFDFASFFLTSIVPSASPIPGQGRAMSLKDVWLTIAEWVHFSTLKNRKAFEQKGLTSFPFVFEKWIKDTVNSRPYLKDSVTQHLHRTFDKSLSRLYSSFQSKNTVSTPPSTCIDLEDTHPILKRLFEEFLRDEFAITKKLLKTKKRVDVVKLIENFDESVLLDWLRDLRPLEFNNRTLITNPKVRWTLVNFLNWIDLTLCFRPSSMTLLCPHQPSFSQPGEQEDEGIITMLPVLDQDSLPSSLGFRISHPSSWAPMEVLFVHPDLRHLIDARSVIVEGSQSTGLKEGSSLLKLVAKIEESLGNPFAIPDTHAFFQHLLLASLSISYDWANPATYYQLEEEEAFLKASQPGRFSFVDVVEIIEIFKPWFSRTDVCGCLEYVLFFLLDQHDRALFSSSAKENAKFVVRDQLRRLSRVIDSLKLERNQWEIVWSQRNCAFLYFERGPDLLLELKTRAETMTSGDQGLSLLETRKKWLASHPLSKLREGRTLKEIAEGIESKESAHDQDAFEREGDWIFWELKNALHFPLSSFHGHTRNKVALTSPLARAVLIQHFRASLSRFQQRTAFPTDPFFVKMLRKTLDALSKMEYCDIRSPVVQILIDQIMSRSNPSFERAATIVRSLAEWSDQRPERLSVVASFVESAPGKYVLPLQCHFEAHIGLRPGPSVEESKELLRKCLEPWITLINAKTGLEENERLSVALSLWSKISGVFESQIVSIELGDRVASDLSEALSSFEFRKDTRSKVITAIDLRSLWPDTIPSRLFQCWEGLCSSRTSSALPVTFVDPEALCQSFMEDLDRSFNSPFLHHPRKSHSSC